MRAILLVLLALAISAVGGAMASENGFITKETDGFYLNLAGTGHENLILANERGPNGENSDDISITYIQNGVSHEVGNRLLRVDNQGIYYMKDIPTDRVTAMTVRISDCRGELKAITQWNS